MLRLMMLGLGVVTLAQVNPSGCLPLPFAVPPPGSGAAPQTLEAQVIAPPFAQVGETVEMIAQVAAPEEAGTISYRWYQVFGRMVQLSDDRAASVTFQAPSLGQNQRLAFRVDVRSSQGATGSAWTEVEIAADPNYTQPRGPAQPEEGTGDELPRVRLVTSKGTIVLELNRKRAPRTVANFLQYVDDGFYNGTIFHRVIPDFVIQGGAYEPGLKKKEGRPAIINESNNGLRNTRGTIAMARTADLDSATSQFFINLKDNPTLDATSGNNGYAVFGRVIEGMDVVDAIGEVETESREGEDGSAFDDVPKEDVLITTAERLASIPPTPQPNENGGTVTPPRTGGDGTSVVP